MPIAADHRLDCAIVGAGAAGLFCAHRLSRAEPDNAFALFEMSGRIGGRLCSVNTTGAGSPAELGAHFVSDQHEHLCGLARHLNLGMRPVNFEPQRYFLRGEFFGPNPAEAGESGCYRLSAKERGKHPHALLLDALGALFPIIARRPEFSAESEDSLQHILGALRLAEIDGRPLCEWGFWNLLATRLSNEAYELLLASHGAASAFRNANAYDAIATLLLEARPGQAYYRFAEGFSALAGALLAACGPNLSLRASHRLAAVQTSSEGLTLRFETAEGPRVVEARRVILALPKRALEGVAFDAALVGDQFGADLASVTPVAASKLYLEFDRVAEADAWSGAEEHIAASYTDMPMRQCYHFSSSDPASPDGRLLMASFADDAATSFWSELARDADVDDFSATQEMIDAAHAQLSLLFPGQNLPKPARGFFVDWSQARRGGAWHAWVPGVRGWEVRERIRQPNSNVPLFICGEAFSQLQGWTEGAINNAEMMLERHFGLSRPIWVRGDYAFEF